MALTADRDRQVSGGQLGSRLPLIASSLVFSGSLLSFDATGYVNRLVAGQPFAGIALTRVEAIDWPLIGPSNGDRNATAATGFGFMVVSLAGASQADAQRQRKVYASDDDTFTYTALGNTYIGETAAYLGGNLIMVFWTTVAQRDEVPGALGVVNYADNAVTVLTNDLNKVIHAPISTARTYTLPPVAQAVGHYFTFVNTGGAFVLTLAANAAEKVGGAASIALNGALGASVTVFGTGVAGAEWAVIGKN